MEDGYKMNLELGDEFISKRTRYRRNLKDTQDSMDIHQEHDQCVIEQVPELEHEEEREQTPRQSDNFFLGANNDYIDWASMIAKDVMKEEQHAANAHLQPDNLDDFLNSKECFTEIDVKVDKSRGEIFFMVLKFCIVNGLSSTGMVNLFMLINTLFQTNILPSSQYFFDKMLNPHDDIEFHAVCPTCKAYVGEFSKIKNVKKCSSCNCDLNLIHTSNTSFFMLINPSKQIFDLLKTYEDHFDYVMNTRTSETGIIEDIYDCNKYREFKNALPESEKTKYVSAMLNTDGAPVFKSSSYSIWPIFLKLNELPKQERMTNLVTVGLWFNKEKPEMPVFLDELVNMVNNLNINGFPSLIKKQKFRMKLHILNSCVDSVARAPMQGLKLFNGYFGCSWCLHPGEYAEKAMRYPYMYPAPPLRNHQDTVNLSLERRIDFPQGIKHPSPLINLPYFDIIHGFLPDYLHACLEGVGAQFTSYFLDSKSDDEISMLNVEMEKIAVPQQIQRLCRPLNTRNDWKAREWENFILYYSIPIFSLFMSSSQINHWIFFVESMHILLQEKIPVNNLNKADEMLHTFVMQSQKLYGIKSMTFNLHQLLHLCEAVLNWGPLWTNSTFCFESANYYVLRAIKSAKGVTHQVVRHVNMIHNMSIVEFFVGKKASIDTINYCQDILTSKLKNYARSDKIMYFGRGEDFDDEDIMHRYGLSENATFYSKAVINRCLYESFKKKKYRSNNSYAQLDDKKFCKIIGFVYDEDRNLELLLCNYLETRDFSLCCKSIQKICRVSDELQVLQIASLKRICVHMEIKKKGYVCPVPNLLHY